MAYKVARLFQWVHTRIRCAGLARYNQSGCWLHEYFTSSAAKTTKYKQIEKSLASISSREDFRLSLKTILSSVHTSIHAKSWEIRFNQFN